MLYVNDFGCQYHNGEDAQCTCSIFRTDAPPSHPRIFALSIKDGQSEDEAKKAYRGLASPEMKKEGFEYLGLNGQGDPVYVPEGSEWWK